MQGVHKYEVARLFSCLSSETGCPGVDSQASRDLLVCCLGSVGVSSLFFINVKLCCPILEVSVPGWD